MPQPHILRIVVASPDDVQAEREVLAVVAEELNRGVAAQAGLRIEIGHWQMDAYPGFHPEGPQGLIDPILKIEDCDLLIGIFWKQLGMSTGNAKSRMEHEFRTAYEAWKKTSRPQLMIYFNQRAYNPKSKAEAEQWVQVLGFKESFPEEGLWWPYKGTANFERLVRNHLTGWIRQQEASAMVSAETQKVSGNKTEIKDVHGNVTIEINPGERGTATFVNPGIGHRTVPFLAPPRPSYNLVGRESLLSDLKEHLIHQGEAALIALHGLPGIGKTALAIELAYDSQVLEHFRDGVLWAGLGRRTDVLVILGTWAEALEIAFEETDTRDYKSRAKAIRDVVRNRRMLLVLDDVWEDQEALDLKLGSHDSAHVVTTRRPAVALRFENAKRIEVSQLTDEHGVELLQRLAREAVEAKPEEARKLVQAAGCLPLALILMGNYLRVQTYGGNQRRLQNALTRLHQVKERLELEQAYARWQRPPGLPEDTPLTLEAVIEITANALSQNLRQTLHSLSVFPPKPNTFSEEAALAVSEASHEMLDTLFIEYGLLESSGSDRYMLHRTINDYARLKSSKKNAEASSLRMIEYFINLIKAHEKEYDALDSERTNILAAIETSYNWGMHAQFIRGVHAFNEYLERRGLYETAERYLSNALKSTETHGNTVEKAFFLAKLGQVDEKRGNYKRAKEHLERCLSCKECDSKLTVNVLISLGIVEYNFSNYTKASKYLYKALRLSHRIKDRASKSHIYQRLGDVLFASGKLREAICCNEKGFQIAKEDGDPVRMSALLTNLGVIAIWCEQLDTAEKYLREGLRHAQGTYDTERINALRAPLGLVALIRGDILQSEQLVIQSLKEIREIGHRWYTSSFLDIWGKIQLVRVIKESKEEHREKWIQEAREAFLNSLEIAQDIQSKELIANAYYDLAEVSLAERRLDKALDYAKESQAIFQSIGHRMAPIVERFISSEGKISAWIRQEDDI